LEPQNSPERALAGMNSKNMEVKNILNKLIRRISAPFLYDRLKAFLGLTFSRLVAALLVMPGEYSAVAVVVKRNIR
jgi:hypothetical protein